MIKILLLSANPSDTTRLRLDAEFREIDFALRDAEFRDKFILEKHLAVRVSDLQNLLLRYKPNIVHFSGHGNTASEIMVEDIYGKGHSIPVVALEDLFSIFNDSVRCVILNACYSETQAKAISKHVDCVIGMSMSIGDMAAISFAKSFYQAIGYGKDVNTAFKLGCSEIDLEKLGEENTPKLILREGIDASKLDFPEVFKAQELNKELPFIQSQELYIDSIRKLLKARVITDVQFESFYHKFFPIEIITTIPLYWKIEFLIQYCQKSSKLDDLLLHIKSYNDAEYNKYVHDKNQRSIHVFSPWIYSWQQLLRNILAKVIPARKSQGNIVKAQCEITISFSFEQFNGDIKATAISAIAHEFNIPTDQIKVINMREGSVIIKLEIPSQALDKIISAYEENKSGILKTLGIDYVVEINDIPFSLERINTMFIQGFSLKQIREFCQQNYSSLTIDKTQGDIKLISNVLVENAIRTSEIPHLLELVKQYNPQAYEKYKPYYKIVRKPFQKTKQHNNNKSLEKLTLKEMVVALTKGFSIAFVGGLLLSLMNMGLEGVRIPIIVIMVFNLLFSYASILLGNAVGDQVRVAANNKDDPRLGKIAVTSYLLGYIGGSAYPIILMWFLEKFENKYADIILSLCVLPIFILVGFIVLIASYVFNPYGIIYCIFDILRLIVGSYFAYQHANPRPKIL